MVMNVKGSGAVREWVKPAHQSVRRILLHPTQSAKGAALRLRYFKSVEQSIVENIRVRVEGKTLIAAVPNTASVAKAWAYICLLKPMEPPIVNLIRLLR